MNPANERSARSSAGTSDFTDQVVTVADRSRPAGTMIKTLAGARCPARRHLFRLVALVPGPFRSQETGPSEPHPPRAEPDPQRGSAQAPKPGDYYEPAMIPSNSMSVLQFIKALRCAFAHWPRESLSTIFVETMSQVMLIRKRDI
jgi:hypothetical protein